jgi:TolB protein
MASHPAAASSIRRWQSGLRCVVSALLASILAGGGGSAPVAAQRLSPDEGIAFESTRDGNSEIYLMTVDGSIQLRLTNNRAQDAAPSVSRDGQIAFASNRDGNWGIYSMARGETPAPVASTPAVEFAPVWSPDGGTIAFTRSSPDPGLSELFLFDRSSGEERRLTGLRGQNFAPTFSPGGDRVAFVHGENRRFHVVIATLDGTVETDLSARSGQNADFEPAWSPTGNEIALSRRSPNGNYDIWAIDVASAAARRLTTGPAEDSRPTWSPDGKQLAFVRGGDGGYEVYAMNADGTNQRDLSNSIAGADVAPVWSANVPIAQAPAAMRASLPASRVTMGSAGFFCTKVGTRRGETLNGTVGIDVICGLGGRDTIRGLGAGDVLAGGIGNDRLFGGRGADTLFARVGFGREQDTVSGGAGAGDMGWVDRGLDTVKRDVEVRRP